MFNKGKALLISVLGSIILMVIFTIVENLIPFEKVFHYSSSQVGWHIIWLVLLFHFIQKNKKNGNDKKAEKTLWRDVLIYVLFSPVGAQKSIYDIQKIKAQKAGLSIQNNMFVYVLAILLYIFYILGFIGFIFFSTIQTKNLAELNSYISEINSSTLQGGDGCGVGYQPQFITDCTPNIERGEVMLKFNSYPYWLHGVQWHEALNVKTNGSTLYFTTAGQIIVAAVEADKKKNFTKCLNSPEANNTAEEQMEFCECRFKVIKDSTFQLALERVNRKTEIKSESFQERESWKKEGEEIVQHNIKEKCGHLIHHRSQK